MWFAIPAIMPTLKKPACLALDHPICKNCMTEKTLQNDKGAIIMSKFEKDPTCMFCAPYSDAAGCGGIGPNFVNEWYKGDKPPLRKPATFTKKAGLTSDDITYSNVAGVGGTIILRLLIGPFAEQYGVRLAVTFTLLVSCIPGFLAAGDIQCHAQQLFFPLFPLDPATKIA